ncbi:outer membrane usher protein [Vibrio sp. B1FIG11]|uniref:fimbria/pilus outer membrane usher protein n=1 Tax=Vibrio sp. B1FIG11 TaxID=2751177 RepID=UPI001AF42C59|nr:fimbria/pilus outer membrane usher protein [Vibrio sp. B1FIG11]CAD7826899.1 outer membrane usher protein [Vibrio sp. B1FIG11]CAE6962044.1 outer membrane usher protein [Vibrio sp. B1FIG11]
MVKIAIFSLLFMISTRLMASDISSSFFNVNSDFLGGAAVNSSILAENSYLSEGEYFVDVVLNNNLLEQKLLNFHFDEKKELVACVSPYDLVYWGISYDSTSKDVCVDLNQDFPLATSHFLVDEHQYILDVPQVYLEKDSPFITNPKLWDVGKNSFIANYYLSGSKYFGTGKDSLFSSFQSGLNIGEWRFRNSSTWSYVNDDSEFESIGTYIDRAYSFGQGGILTIGQTSTANTIFQSYGFEGIKLSSDTQMLAYDKRNFSPSIKGIASTPAIVYLKQNGRILYQKSVPAGPFELEDLDIGYNQGDMLVEVVESSGKTTSYTFSPASLPVLQKEGTYSYSVSAGRLRNTESRSKPLFLDSTISYGFTDNSTVYGGGQISQDFYALALGFGHYHPILGAMSLDLTHSISEFDPRTALGSQIKAAYAKNFGSSGTSLTANIRHNLSRDFFTFGEIPDNSSGLDVNSQNFKSRYMLSISQRLGLDNRYGSLSLSGTFDKYFDLDHSYFINSSYSKTIERFTLNMGLQYNRSKDDNNLVSLLSISFPIDYKEHEAYVFSNTRFNEDDLYTDLGVTGQLLDDKANYSLALGKNTKGNESYRGAVSYQSSVVKLDASINRSDNIDWANLTLEGGLVAFDKGVTLSQTLSMEQGNALIDANDTQGVSFKTHRGITTNSQGYAVVPNLRAFSENKIDIDVDKLPVDTDIIDSSQKVIPSKGALSVIKFDVKKGHRVLFKVANVKDIPTGAEAVIEQDGKLVSKGMIDGGNLYLSGVPDSGKIKVFWLSKKLKNESCEADFLINKESDGLIMTDVLCN